MIEHIETIKKKVADPNNRLLIGMGLGAVGVIGLLRFKSPLMLTVTQEMAQSFVQQEECCKVLLFKSRVLGTMVLTMV